MKKVPEGVIERLPAYLNCLLQIEAEGAATTSSKRLGQMTGINPAEIRRDLVYFGSFGIKGVGYEVKYLIKEIKGILGSDHPHQIAIIGAGHLGSAIASHNGLRNHGFFVSAIFDKDADKIGVELGGVKVTALKALPQTMRKRKISIAILAVPPTAAQAVADLLVEAGVSVILNYTSVMITVPDAVQVHNSDPVNELLYTLHYLSGKRPGVK